MTASSRGSDARHGVVLASAGTGKTYRLTSRYLALLADGTDPARVLATTFTRKAAGEIAHRVLQRLARATSDPAELQRLSAAVAAERHGEGLDADGCRALLVRTVRALHRLDVLTLDAFFVKLGILFGLDLGLPTGWSVAEEVEDAALREEAVSRVLAGAPTERLVTLLAALDRGDPGRSARSSLLRAVSDGYDVFRESSPAAWRVVQPSDRLDDDRLAEVLGELEALSPGTSPKTGKVLKNWKTQQEKLVGLARRGDWKEVLKHGLVTRVLDGTPEYYGGLIEEHHRAVVEPLGRHAGGELVAREAARGEAMVDLLGRFDEAYQQLKAERRLYRFEDLPRRLRGAGPGAEDLAFRLGEGLDHLLLDEFQDTSVTQWGVLEPLVESVLDPAHPERSFFCVGDVKQSIYAWRAGEPRLLAELADRYDLPRDALDRSYRSAPVILDTVNRVFERVAELPVFDDDEALAAGARRWQARFSPQSSARGELAGAARVWRFEPDEDAGDAEADFDGWVADHVAALADARPTQTIGVLYRRNHSIPRLMHALKQRGLHASGEGGAPLTDSDAVLAALSALQLADHPGDRAALFHVATSPLGGHLGLGVEDLPPKRGTSARVAVWAAGLRRRLAERGLGAVLASFRPAFAEAEPWDARRFAQLVDLAYAQQDRATLRPSDFVEVVRGTSVEDPTSSQVTVMTIHASKGLEFDVVVMPELCRSRGRGGEGLLVHRPDAWGPVEAVFPAVSRAVAATHERLAAMVAAQRAADLEEKLCNLYVGMTRAVRRLDLMLEGTSEKHSFGRLVELALEVPAGAGEVWRHPDSSDDEARAVGEAVPVRPSSRDGRRRLALAPAVGRRPARRAPSRHGEATAATPAEERRRLERLLGVDDAGGASGAGVAGGGYGRLRGLAVHRWMERLTWLGADGVRDVRDVRDVDTARAEARAALGADGLGLGDDALADWHAAFVAALDEPAVLEVLDPDRVTVGPDARRPDRDARHDGRLEVWTERGFLRREPSGDGRATVVAGSCDRVVVLREAPGGAVVAVDVIDHKSDRLADEQALDARVRDYVPQVVTYVESVAAVLHLSPDRIRGRMLFLAPFGPGSARLVDLPGNGT